MSSDQAPACALTAVKIRDFAFPADDPRHSGLPLPEQQKSHSDLSTEATFSDKPSTEEKWTGTARALYDFVPQNPAEIPLKESDIVHVKCKQYPGWLMAEHNGKQGLIPENYVEILSNSEAASQQDHTVRVSDHKKQE